MKVDERQPIEHRRLDQLAEGDDHAEVGAGADHVGDGVVTGSPSSRAAAFTGLGVRSPPRPRRVSGRLTTRATSWPPSTRARSGGTASAGEPR